ncbi:MAG: hypothetical protein Q8P05_05620 [Candidatus Diapherotrites archaeon]|nr:hypothetical protein [Candidatus Diapherotrites archaeon]MDZ4256468.1 hypothetical protein [archaeon]
MPPPKPKRSFWQKLDPFTYVDDYVVPILNPWNNSIFNWIIYLLFSFFFAFAIYSIIGFLLQTATPLVIVVSGSMLPSMARGDVVVLQGISGVTVNAPLVVLDTVDVRQTSLEDLADFERVAGGDWKLTFKANNQTILVPSRGDTDILVYVSDHRGLEIIHRAIVKIKSGDDYFFLTKGDNNPSLDQDCGKVESIPIPGTAIPQIVTQKPCPSPYPIPEDKVNGKALFWIPYVGYVKLLLFDQ